jgi:RNA polymerase sigma factor (TIGR02999 family)
MPDDIEMEQLFAALYPDLKRLAHARLRRNGPHTLLDTTGLVNDAYLKMAATTSLEKISPGRLLAYAARTMRSVVVDLVREHAALRRGGDLDRVTLVTAVVDAAAPQLEALALDEALKELAALEPRLSQVVEMRYFGGFSEVEIADALGLTERTVRRDWEKARLLLRAMLDPN